MNLTYTKIKPHDNEIYYKAMNITIKKIGVRLLSNVHRSHVR